MPPRSLNAVFAGNEEVVDLDQPPGESIANTLQAAMREWATSPVDNWRDVGWSFRCERDGAEVEVVVASVDGAAWLLQIDGGGGTFRKPRGSVEDCLAVAQAAQSALAASGRYREFHWRWNGEPANGDPAEPPASES